MFNGLVDAIDALFEFVSKHRGELSDHSTILTPEQMKDLAALDIKFHAHCQLSGQSLSFISEPEKSSFPLFGHSKLPYFPGTFHIPIKDGAGKVTHDQVGRGMMLMPTSEWKHALMSLRATAVLKSKAEENGRAPPIPSSSHHGASLDTTTETKDGDGHRAGGTRGKRKRGRPSGSRTKAHDCKIYEDWKAARRESGITKSEFVHEKGLPESELAAIERGRKHSQKKKPPGKNDWK
jgi:hypothetical protein